MLDTTRKYGTCHGGIVKFEQDGKLFDAHHNEIDIDGNLIEKKKPAKKETIVLPGEPVEESGVAVAEEPAPPADDKKKSKKSLWG